jgi:hypothetical protein
MQPATAGSGRAANAGNGASAAVMMSTPGLSTMAAAQAMAAKMAMVGVAGAGAAGSGAVSMVAAGSGAAGTSGASAAMSVGAAGHTAAAGSGAAGAGGPADAATACGEGAMMVTGMARKEGNGNTNLRTSGTVEFINWKGTVAVPKNPAPPRGPLFLWPGLQPLQMDNKVGYGVLQPVLTWGTSCADMTNTAYDHWWISGVYVGTTPGSWTNVSCKAGSPMNVAVSDLLDIEMTLSGTNWKSTMTDRSSGKTVTFDYDLKGQKQQWLLHQIEAQGQTKPVDDVIFTNVVAQLSDSQPASCYPSETGASDYFSPPRASADGKTCCFSKIILRASGAMATSPNQP